MIHAVKSGYVNPQDRMRQSYQMKAVNVKTSEEDEKKQRMLKEEKKSVQNSLLLMKTTSGDSAEPKESIERLEKKLEEIENQIKAGEKEAADILTKDESIAQESKETLIKNNFDVYCRS